MTSYKIFEEIKKLKDDKSKAYYFLYADSGFELGFGKAGKYSGHSHKYFYDIIFSQDQITVIDTYGKSISNNMIVIPPKTYFREIITSNFFFMKFCPTNEIVLLPDKIESIENEGVICGFSEHTNIDFPWYQKHHLRQTRCKLRLAYNELEIIIGNNYFLIS